MKTEFLKILERHLSEEQLQKIAAELQAVNDKPVIRDPRTVDENTPAGTLVDVWDIGGLRDYIVLLPFKGMSTTTPLPFKAGGSNWRAARKWYGMQVPEWDGVGVNGDGKPHWTGRTAVILVSGEHNSRNSMSSFVWIKTGNGSDIAYAWPITGDGLFDTERWETGLPK